MRALTGPIILLLLLAARSGLSQQTITLSLYYKINESSSKPHERRIDSLFEKLKGRTFNVTVTGFTDFLAADGYNKKLSEARASEVCAYLRTKSSEPQMSILSCKGEGEKHSRDNGSADGEPAGRRVEITVTLTGPVKKVDTRPIEVVKPLPDEAVPDTTKHLNSLKVGQTLNLKGLQFVGGTHRLIKSAEKPLADLLEQLKKNPQLRIEIQGHVCCIDEEPDGYDFDTKNRTLSVNRARAIYDYLVENGIDPSRLRYKGFGHTKPLVHPERTPADEQRNRRVEIMILDK